MFESLNKLIKNYLPKNEIKLLRQVYIVARDAHEEQIRSSGEPYITHPVAVACILAKMKLDHETLMAALLHDVIEDTPATYQDMEHLFGKNVAKLVEGVSKLDELKFRNKKEAQAENFRKMVMAMVQDIRVILIKLADRMHNMRTLEALRPDKKRRIALETLEIYSPLANRLGIYYLKTELEELGFEALYPNRFRVIKEAAQNARNNLNQMIQKILSEIDSCLQQAGISCQVSRCEKHFYSIYSKMYRKKKCFNSIMNICSLHIIVKDIDTCYRVLGKIHGLYKPLPGRVKDYIAIPKANGYRSLHTSMMGPYGVPIKVQIRTKEMDYTAEMGVAAYWIYKEPKKNNTTTQIYTQHWIQDLLELQQSSSSSFEFIENVKSDIFSDEIYVFTPKGRIIKLPAGATPVDFAYAVHTNIGHSCIGAFIDHHPYPLSQPLSSGQTIEIITDFNSASPNVTWLNFVVSSKARTKIRQFLKNLKREDLINLGHYLLSHALGSTNIFNKIPEKYIQLEVKRMRLETIDDLLIEIGLGNIMSMVIAKNILRLNNKVLDISKKDKNIPIKDVDEMLVTFAMCCRPIPGDKIIAHSNLGKGLIIHHICCHNVRNYRKESKKCMVVDWNQEICQEFISEIKVDMLNHQGALANLTTTINKANSSVRSLNTEEHNNGHIYRAFIRLTTTNRIHLAQILRKIRVMSDVIKVSRNQK